jgi:hypothetical protein
MKTHPLLGRFLLIFVLMLPVSAQEHADLNAYSKIWQEAATGSQIMELASYLSDVIGPRITGTPALNKAYAWAAGKYREWGLDNVALEPWGEFGPGWSNIRLSVHMTAPYYQPLIAYPVPWTRSTSGKIFGQPVRVLIETPEDFRKYRGKLKGAIVLVTPPRSAPPMFTASAVRMDDEDLKGMARVSVPMKAADKADADRRPKWKELEDFFRQEQVGVVIQPSSPSRWDYGTVKVEAYDLEGKNQRVVDQNPRLIMAAEQYASLFRILDHKAPLALEVEILNMFHEKDAQAYNVIAEIQGTEKRDELVMLGAHLDSWAAGTGAADNAAGCAVVMEAMRIIKAIGIKPRRTIRAALWSAEEQGIWGSRAYVAEHFGDTDRQTLRRADPKDIDEKRRNPLGDLEKLIIKPNYDKLSGYFNLDNGTGKILGVYLQENIAVRPIFEEWIRPLCDLGVTTLSLGGTYQTDHISFDAIGLPGFQFIQDKIDYMTHVHHTNQDLLDHCLPEDLIQAAVVMAYFVYHTAMREERLPRKALFPPRGRD